MTELDYLKKQLNLIIGFLDVSDTSVYEEIKSHDSLGIGSSIDDLYENEYSNFRNHITTSALILGFTHFEDFMSKMTKKVLIEYPEKNKIKLTIEEFEKLGDEYKSILAEKQTKRMTFSEKIKLLKNIFNDFEESFIEEMEFVNKMRNCLMHNNGVSDGRLKPKFQNGEKIILTAGDVHKYGLMAREFAEELWNRLH